MIITAFSLILAFSYEPPGQLESGSQGRVDHHVYVPGMRYPVENAPSFPNSQVYRPGGSHGPGGGQCDASNFQYPWSDNFCEPRRWEMPLCPGGTGHQGQDIRPADCRDKAHWAVAAEDGVITSIGSFSLYLVADSGTRHRYLHMDPASIPVARGQRVQRGQRLGLISNAYFDANGNRVGTTIHLHYDIHQYVHELDAAVYVPPYMSLVRSYEDLLGEPQAQCEAVPAEGAQIDETSPCFQRWGPLQYWRHVDGEGEGGSMIWTNAFVSETPSNWARWRLRFEEAGSYRVEVMVVDGYNGSQRVPYRVRHDGEEADRILDQRAEAGWRTLGEFDFAAGGDQWLSVYDNSGEEGSDLHITVDAMRLIPVAAVAPPEPEPEAQQIIMGEAPIPSMVDFVGMPVDEAASGCGCQQLPLTEGLLLLLSLGLLRGRRRLTSPRS